MLMVYWSEEGDPLIPLFEAPTLASGFPGRAALRERYAERSGRDLSQLDFYVALGSWKLAIILQGVISRFAAGQYGKGEDADEGLGESLRIVERLAQAADQAERRLG
jgi:aminoglycoside phosphotransferase (APT) family kinase protein